MREKIDRQLQQLQMQQTQIHQQQPQPINNIINTNQTPPSDIINLRVLNENEEVENIYVNNKTFFLGANKLVIKDPDGKIEKYDILKTYPIDPKDKKISELEQQIRELKEMIDNEHGKSNITTKDVERPDTNVVVNDESITKTTSKSIPKKT